MGFKPINLAEFRQKKLDEQAVELAECSNTHSATLNILLTLEPLAKLLVKRTFTAYAISTLALSGIFNLLSLIGVPTKLIWPICVQWMRLQGIPMPWAGG